MTVLASTADVGTVVVHVGDSRLYRLRHGRPTVLTADRTVVADLLRAGEVNVDQAAGHPHQRLLSRALGVAPAVECDHAGVASRPGDRLLLCTDGLFGVLFPEELRDTLATSGDLRRAASDLVSAALAHDADDNVTAIVVDI